MLSGLGVYGNSDYDPRPEYCGLARNTYDSLYFVPFFLVELPDMAPTDFSGKWKLVRSENFDEYLKEMSKSVKLLRCHGNRCCCAGVRISFQ